MLFIDRNIFVSGFFSTLGAISKIVTVLPLHHMPALNYIAAFGDQHFITDHLQPENRKKMRKFIVVVTIHMF